MPQKVNPIVYYRQIPTEYQTYEYCTVQFFTCNNLVYNYPVDSVVTTSRMCYPNDWAELWNAYDCHIYVGHTNKYNNRQKLSAEIVLQG